MYHWTTQCRGTFALVIIADLGPGLMCPGGIAPAPLCRYPLLDFCHRRVALQVRRASSSTALKPAKLTSNGCSCGVQLHGGPNRSGISAESIFASVHLENPSGHPQYSSMPGRNMDRLRNTSVIPSSMHAQTVATETHEDVSACSVACRYFWRTVLLRTSSKRGLNVAVTQKCFTDLPDRRRAKPLYTSQV
jgi:hypothetical protein